MNFLPHEDNQEALYNPKFVTNSVANMDLLEPHADQKVAMGKMFRSNSRIYRYGRAVGNVMTYPGVPCIMDLVDFSCTPSSIESNCMALRPMKDGEYGIFCMLFSTSGGSGGTGDYNQLINIPIYNLPEGDVLLPYTVYPDSRYKVGDKALVEGEVSDLVIQPNIPSCLTIYTFLYCMIDTTSTIDPGVVQFQKCSLGLYNTQVAPKLPLHMPVSKDIVYTDKFIAVTSVTNMYDARVLHNVENGVRVFGWVFLNEYQGNIDAAILEVDAPTDPLPDPTNLRRKNAKKT